MNAYGGCEVAVAAITRYGWVKFRECGVLLYGRRFPLSLKWVAHGSYVIPAMLYGSEAWCLKESELGNLRRTERSMVREMYGVQLIDRKRCKDFMLGLSETIDQLAMASSVCWCGNVLMREDGHALAIVLDFEVKGRCRLMKKV